ncbi:MAG: GspE/PulE family protein [Granulosicoccus sp.]
MNSANVVGEIQAELLSKLIPCSKATACLSETVARRFNCIPLSLKTSTASSARKLNLAIADFPDVTVSERISRHLPPGVIAAFCVTRGAHFDEALNKCYAKELQGEPLIQRCSYRQTTTDQEWVEPNQIVRLVEAVLHAAVNQGTSDIHIAVESDFLDVRFRIDGLIEQFAKLDIAYAEAIAGRIKILAALDISETRIPQDGQFDQFVEGQAVDFRVSSFPTIRGENIVVRVLGAASKTLGKINSLFPIKVKQALLDSLHHPDGIFLFCGPTGSGKSTSLYALIEELDSSTLNIMTLEDPVEIVVPRLRQTNIDQARDFGYAEGLRAILRQDPDVILIGEVRDSSSASMILRASMTGHRVLTTIHASDTFSAIDRLLELGVSRELLGRNLRCIVSQRLVRKICTECLAKRDSRCACRGSGYRGRQAVMEILSITPAISSLIQAHASKEALLREARVEGYETLFELAQQLTLQGVTDSREISRVLGGDSPIYDQQH